MIILNVLSCQPFLETPLLSNSTASNLKPLSNSLFDTLRRPLYDSNKFLIQLPMDPRSPLPLLPLFVIFFHLLLDILILFVFLLLPFSESLLLLNLAHPPTALKIPTRVEVVGGL